MGLVKKMKLEKNADYMKVYLRGDFILVDNVWLKITRTIKARANDGATCWLLVCQDKANCKKLVGGHRVADHKQLKRGVFSYVGTKGLDQGSTGGRRPIAASFG